MVHPRVNEIHVEVNDFWLVEVQIFIYFCSANKSVSKLLLFVLNGSGAGSLVSFFRSTYGFPVTRYRDISLIYCYRIDTTGRSNSFSTIFCFVNPIFLNFIQVFKLPKICKHLRNRLINVFCSCNEMNSV